MARSYWEEREYQEQSWIRRNMRTDADLNKQLQQMYADSLKDINSQIDQFYMRYAGANGITKQEAIKRVAAEDVQAFSNKAKELVASKDFSKEANEQLKLYNATMRINRLEMLKSQVGEQLIALGNEQQAILQKKFTADYLDEIKRQAGILGQDRNKDLVGRVSAVVNGSWQKATWSSRLWDSMAELQATIGIQLNRFMVQGLNPRVIARQLKPLLSETVQNRTAIAERLARTESARVQDAASMAMFKKYGVKQVKWVAEPSACKQCRDIASYNHGIYLLDDVPMIPAHPNCRCAKAAYVEANNLSGAKEAKDANIDVLESADPINTIRTKMGAIKLSSASKDDIIGLGKAANSACHFDKILGDKEQLKTAFAQFREMGGQVDKETWYTRSNRTVKQQLQAAFSYYPKQWADYLQQNNQRLFAGKKSRGFFVPDLVNASLTRYLPGAKYGDGVSIYSSGVRETTPYHEIGHMVDHFNPDLVRIEKEFVASRTKGEDATRLNNIFPGFGYRLSETTKKDDFINPYIGKEYKNATEVLSIGLESVFEPGKGQLKSVTNGDYVYKLITDDPEYFNLIIGLILKG